MKELVDWFNESVSEETQHPLILIGVFIVVFLAIHPFKDGNGRLSRVLTTLLLLRAGYTVRPYSSMESVIEANKDNYYLALRRTQQTIRKEKQNWESWLRVFPEDDGQAEEQSCREGQRGADSALVFAGAFPPDTGTGENAEGNHGQGNRGIDWREPQHDQSAFAKAGKR